MVHCVLLEVRETVSRDIHGRIQTEKKSEMLAE